MSTKVITDPSALGWEQDGATSNGTPIYKWAEGADNEHPIVDGDTEGQVTTWDGDKWTPDSTVVVKGGRLGIGTGSPNRTLTVNNNTGSIVAAQYDRDNSNGGGTSNVIYQYAADGVGRLVYRVENAGTENYIQSSGDFRLVADAGSSLKFDTNGNNNRLTIDASGKATFSGAVNAGEAQFAGNPGIGEAGVKTFSGGQLYTGVLESGRSNAFRVYGGGNITTQIWANGDVDFSGESSAKTLVTTRGTNGFFIKAEYGTTGISTTFGHNNGGSSFSINPAGGSMTVAGDFSANNVRTAGGPVIDAKGLIKTLSTLRNATKDETTLEGMRDALADAIGGLIENLEHEIATMPAPEPEVSTMPVGDES